ncbi:glycosyl transferase [Cellulosimicrobium funkei]|nr:glycosyl transferase [Cellulosimicrobium funkei]
MSSPPTLLYYAHDHGSGHLHHAARLAATGAFSLTVATASAAADRILPPGTPIARLPSDVVPGHHQPPASQLHYTPTGRVIRDRFATLLETVQRVEPDAVVVDVSVEAALFLRVAGYPVIYRRMHGDRMDPAHDLAYTESDHLITYYGSALEDPEWRDRFAAKTTFLGVPDRSGRLATSARQPSGPAATPQVTVVTGLGGGGVDVADLARAASQVPWARWNVYGATRGSSRVPTNLVLHGWAEDAAARMREADVVVVSAGFSAVTHAVGAARPLVLAVEQRPFHEQDRFAAAAKAAAGIPWCRWEDVDTDWSAAVTAALDEPSSADRLAAAILTDPDDHRRAWESAVASAAHPGATPQ